MAGPTNPSSSFGPGGGAFGAGFKNVAVQIDVQDATQYITSIVYGYSLINPSGHAFVLGRLILVRGKPDVSALDISPLSFVLPDQLRSSVLFDTTLTTPTKDIQFGGRGFELQPYSIYTAILTGPVTSTDVWPAAEPYNGFLNVIGESANKQDPFPKVR